MISLSNYQILCHIYESANSIVCRARRKADNQPVILKMLKPNSPNPEELGRYQREYSLIRSLSLPAVIEAYRLETDQNGLFMVLEDFGGDSLKTLVNPFRPPFTKECRNLSSTEPPPNPLLTNHPPFPLLNKEGVRGGLSKKFQASEARNALPLSQFEKGEIGEISLSNFLALAIQIAESLNQIHLANIIHKNINPSNIIWNRNTNQLKIIDFGIATRLPRENPPNKNPNQLEGNINYISPEQTGRINCSLDYRTDLYSLGVTFYELLTGQLPFNATDPLTIIHGHIAKTPTPINKMNPNVPKILANIVSKLMAKNPADRYQSVFGLKSDLEKCLQQIEFLKNGQNVFFELAQQDVSEKFHIPQKLYGRAQEIKILSQTFKRICTLALGGAEMVLISGPSGIGKSALVCEIHQSIMQQQGYFVAGRFEPLCSSPYSAITQAFNTFCDYLLTENHTTINQWREILLTAIGENGPILIEVIPHLEKIIGQQSPVAKVSQRDFSKIEPSKEEKPHFAKGGLGGISPSESGAPHFAKGGLGGIFPSEPGAPHFGKGGLGGISPSDSLKESQNRFHFAFQQFFHVLCQAEHPFVLFIDNLQWADLPALHLLRDLMGDRNNQYFLLIGAYQNNEVDATHPLLTTIKEIETTAIVHHIELQNLSFNDVNTLIADTLQNQNIQALAQLVYGKTQGNPFLTKETLKSLYEQKLLSFNPHTRQWQWEIDKIISTDITNDAIVLMINKISELPDDTQEILKLAAGIGNQFDLTTLSVISQQNPETTLMQLWIAMEEGFLFALDDYYKQLATGETTQTTPRFKFQHESIQQAAYSLIPDAEKSRLHLQIEQFLLSHVYSFDSHLPEQAVAFHSENQQFTQGKLYETQSHDQLWQATTKVKEVEKRHSHRFAKTSSNSLKNLITFEATQESITGSTLALDLNRMLKASQALSSEIVLETLLRKMMKLVIESAGAQRGILILNTNGQWMIEAVYTIELDKVTVLQSIPIQPKNVLETPMVSTAIVNYVMNTKKKVVLSDATHDPRFFHDNYITQQRPKSVLCLPLVNQNQLVGILYLENNFMVGAFTSERLEILNLLSSQMAISINNAKLYAELRENEKTLKQFLEAVPVAVGMLDKNGKPYYVNQRAQKILGQGIAPDATADQIAEVYQNYIAGTDQVYPAEKLPIVRALQGENAYVDDIEIHQDAHKIIPIEAWGTPVLDEKGHVAYALVAFQDITERKQAERLQQKYHQHLEQEVAERTQKLRDHEAQLRQAKEAAEAANYAKSQFIATMNHELRTPLNSILGYAQVLQRDSSLEPRQREHVDIIKQSGEHLLTLINDILELAKIEAGKMELDKSDFHLPTFLNSINEMVRIRAESKDILYTYQPFDFSTDMPQNSLPIGVHGDEKRLRQVLINLLGNAIKFTDKGKVTFKVGLLPSFQTETSCHFERSQKDDCHFELRYKKSLSSNINKISRYARNDTLNQSVSHQKIRFQIEDSGIGIAPEQLNTIFERFQQVGDKERQSQGTGLGLAISHHLVKLMGSQLQVTSELGKGSTFWFEIELPAVSTFSESLPIETQNIIAVKSKTPLKLLIVDDQPDNQKFLADLLLPLGFKVILADNGHEGLMKAIEYQPQLILMDLLMPEIDGFELTRQIRQLPQIKDTIVIIMSASVSKKEHQQSLMVGSHDFLPKPIQAEKLFEQLQRHLAIEWIYEENQTTINETTNKEMGEALILPPLEIIESLFELAMSGDIRGIQQQATQLAQSNEQFAPFASKLQEFANHLQLDKMCDWLESYL